MEFSRQNTGVSIPFSRGSSQLRDWTQVSCMAGRFFSTWATREALVYQTQINTDQERWLLSHRPENSTNFQRFVAKVKSTIALKWWHQGDRERRWELVSIMDILIVKFSCTTFHEVVLGWPSQFIGCILSSLETRSKTSLKKKKKLELLKEKAVLFFKNLNIASSVCFSIEVPYWESPKDCFWLGPITHHCPCRHWMWWVPGGHRWVSHRCFWTF